MRKAKLTYKNKTVNARKMKLCQQKKKCQIHIILVKNILKMPISVKQFEIPNDFKS